MALNLRGGDDGCTDFAGQRVSKDHAAIEALGALDEVGAALGLAAALLDQAGERGLVAQLREFQLALIDLGACLAGLKRCDWQARLGALDELIAEAADVKRPAAFVLQGQNPAGAALHLARTAARRAERRWLTFTAQAGPEQAWLNRLSELLFVLALRTDGGGAT